jgi:hypothetical protein
MAPATTARSCSPLSTLIKELGALRHLRFSGRRAGGWRGSVTSACCTSRLGHDNATGLTHSETSSNYLCTNGGLETVRTPVGRRVASESSHRTRSIAAHKRICSNADRFFHHSRIQWASIAVVSARARSAQRTGLLSERLIRGQITVARKQQCPRHSGQRRMTCRYLAFRLQTSL